MRPKLDCWTRRNYMITSSILLITTLICAQADSINQIESAAGSTKIPEFISTELSKTNCSAIYTPCGHDEFCLKYWDIKKECSAEHTSLKIIKKSKDWIDPDLINNTFLFSSDFCGICTFESQLSKFKSWTRWLFFEIDSTKSQHESSIFISTNFTRSVNSTRMLNVNDSTDDLDLISLFNDSIHQCKVLKTTPNYFKQDARLCTSREWWQTIPMGSPPAIVPIRDGFSRLWNTNSSDSDKEKFCLPKNSSMESFCGYRDEFGDTCSVNKFFNNTIFTCDADGYILWNFTKDGNVLAQCSNHTSKENHIYVCGPAKPNLYKKIKGRVFNVLDHISTFFLFSYLVLSTSKQNLRRLPNRIFYSYSMTLFAFYVFQFPLKYVKSCVIKYYTFFYTWQAHSLWILITSFDLWRLVYNSSKIQKVNVEGQTVRYLVYCILGWGLPGLLLAALFPTLTEDQKYWSCSSVSGFESELVCSSSCDLNKYTLNLNWLSFSIFLVLAPGLLLLTFVFVCLHMRNTARSTANRTYTIVLLKVSIMMGLHWILLVYLTLFDPGEKFNVVYEFISSFHGCFIFFAFGLKENLAKFKSIVSGSVTEETQLKSSSQDNQNAKTAPERAE